MNTSITTMIDALIVRDGGVTCIGTDKYLFCFKQNAASINFECCVLLLMGVGIMFGSVCLFV